MYIPQADSDDDDEVDERERDFDSKEEEKEEIAGSKESEDGTTNEKLTMEEANLIEMINEMQKIVIFPILIYSIIRLMKLKNLFQSLKAKDHLLMTQ